MSLIVEPDRWGSARLDEQLRSLREELDQLRARLSPVPDHLANRWAAETAVGLAEGCVRLADAILAGPEEPDRPRVQAVNLLYDLRNSLPYLLRAARSPPAPLPAPPRASAPAPTPS